MKELGLHVGLKCLTIEIMPRFQIPPAQLVWTWLLFVDILVAGDVVVCMNSLISMMEESLPVYKLHSDSSVRNSDTSRKVLHILRIRRIRNLKLLHDSGQ